MVCKLLVAVFLFAACATYCTADVVYVQRSSPYPLGSCDKVNCVPSTHGGIHTWDCFRNVTRNNTVVNEDFYLLRINGTDANRYYVVREDGSRTEYTATLEKNDSITIYIEYFKFQRYQRVIRFRWCATDVLIPDSNTLAKLNEKCPGMQNNDNTNC